MYVSDDVVDVVLENDNLGVSRLYEYRLEFLEWGIYLNGLDLCTWYETVPYLDAGEIERILEYAYVIVNVLLFIGILY